MVFFGNIYWVFKGLNYKEKKKLFKEKYYCWIVLNFLIDKFMVGWEIIKIF